MCHGARYLWLQTRVLGFNYGEWGRKNYPGVKGAKADLMDWYVKRLTELRRLILEEQETCSKRPGPTAFVTFQYVTPLGPPSASPAPPPPLSAQPAACNPCLTAPSELPWSRCQHPDPMAHQMRLWTLSSLRGRLVRQTAVT